MPCKSLAKEYLILQGVAQVVVHLRKKGLELDGPAIADNGLVKLPEFREGDPAIVMRLPKIRAQNRGRVIAGERLTASSSRPCPIIASAL